MFRNAAITAAVVLGLLAPQMAYAQRDRREEGPPASVGRAAATQQQQARQGVQEGRLVPMAQVIAALNKRTPGKQQDAKIDRVGERQVYRIPWVTSDGRRIDYVVDAQSGAILSGG
jgi:uncharacterized membrane protein YkoI